MKIFWISLINLVGWSSSLAFPGGGPMPQSPPKFSDHDKPDSWFSFVSAASTNQLHPATGPAFGNSFPTFAVNNFKIIWAAPTNQSRTALWVCRVAPGTFSGKIVSNLMTLGSFTMHDEQKWQRKISEINNDPLLFANQSNTCNLLIVPEQGRIEYWDGYAPANHWDRTNHLWEQVAGVPDDAKVKKLGLKLLKQFGIRSTDLAQDADGHLITFRENQIRGYFDRRRGKYIDDEVIARGVNFDRRIDGINFAGIGVGGGCEIMFGNHAKIADFKLVWRNLQPYERYPVASPDEIIQKILDGQAVLTHKNIVDPADVKKLTITDCSPLYMGASGEQSQDLVYPFAKIEAVADVGNTNIEIELYCPILSTKL
jgi:hypothetical protein